MASVTLLRVIEKGPTFNLGNKDDVDYLKFLAFSMAKKFEGVSLETIKNFKSEFGSKSVEVEFLNVIINLFRVVLNSEEPIAKAFSSLFLDYLNTNGSELPKLLNQRPAQMGGATSPLGLAGKTLAAIGILLSGLHIGQLGTGAREPTPTPTVIPAWLLPAPDTTNSMPSVLAEPGLLQRPGSEWVEARRLSDNVNKASKTWGAAAVAKAEAGAAAEIFYGVLGINADLASSSGYVDESLVTGTMGKFINQRKQLSGNQVEYGALQLEVDSLLAKQNRHEGRLKTWFDKPSANEIKENAILSAILRTKQARMAEIEATGAALAAAPNPVDNPRLAANVLSDVGAELLRNILIRGDPNALAIIAPMIRAQSGLLLSSVESLVTETDLALAAASSDLEQKNAILESATREGANAQRDLNLVRRSIESQKAIRERANQHIANSTRETKSLLGYTTKTTNLGIYPQARENSAQASVYIAQLEARLPPLESTNDVNVAKVAKALSDQQISSERHAAAVLASQQAKTQLQALQSGIEVVESSTPQLLLTNRSYPSYPNNNNNSNTITAVNVSRPSPLTIPGGFEMRISTSGQELTVAVPSGASINMSPDQFINSLALTLNMNATLKHVKSITNGSFVDTKAIENIVWGPTGRGRSEYLLAIENTLVLYAHTVAEQISSISYTHAVEAFNRFAEAKAEMGFGILSKSIASQIKRQNPELNDGELNTIEGFALQYVIDINRNFDGRIPNTDNLGKLANVIFKQYNKEAVDLMPVAKINLKLSIADMKNPRQFFARLSQLGFDWVIVGGILTLSLGAGVLSDVVISNIAHLNACCARLNARGEGHHRRYEELENEEQQLRLNTIRRRRAAAAAAPAPPAPAPPAPAPPAPAPLAPAPPAPAPPAPAPPAPAPQNAADANAARAANALLALAGVPQGGPQGGRRRKTRKGRKARKARKTLRKH
jgi:hypothetical protein